MVGAGGGGAGGREGGGGGWSVNIKIHEFLQLPYFDVCSHSHSCRCTAGKRDLLENFEFKKR